MRDAAQGEQQRVTDATEHPRFMLLAQVVELVGIQQDKTRGILYQITWKGSERDSAQLCKNPQLKMLQ